jgi:4-hydroxymandelate oxidase
MTSPWLAALEGAAGRALPAVFYEYYRQGAGASVSADEAAAAWLRHRIVPRVLRDVTTVSLEATFLGSPATLPLGVAPTTLQRAADPGGEVAMARGCARAGVPLVLSSNASASFAEVAAQGATWWLQAYLTEDRALAEPMLATAVEAGAAAVVLTVDTPVVAVKQDGGGPSALTQVPSEWLRRNLGDAADAPKARDLVPADITRLAAFTGLPVVVKGVLDPDDAARAVEAGAAAVWVSNHGGRQLDRAAATADCLEDVVARVGRAAQVYVDGGVNDPISVLTALAMGADGIFLGRFPLFALALDGSEGVVRLFSELAVGLEEAFRVSGSTRAPHGQILNDIGVVRTGTVHLPNTSRGRQRPRTETKIVPLTCDNAECGPDHTDSI